MGVLKSLGKGLKKIGKGVSTGLDKFSSGVSKITDPLSKIVNPIAGLATSLNPITGLIGAGVGLYQGFQQNKEAQRQFDVQQNFAEQQFAWQQQLNEQGSMKNRVQDMMDAGLHPTLAAGGAGAPSGGAPVSSAQPTTRAQSIMEQALAGAQLGLLESQKNNIDADTEQKQVSTETERTLGRAEIQQRIALGQASIDEIRRSLDSGILSIEYLNEVIENMKSQTAWLKEQTSSSEEATRIATETFNLESVRLEWNLERLKDSKMHESQLSTEMAIIRSVITELTTGDPEKIKEAMSKLSDTIIHLLPSPVQSFIRLFRSKK